MESCVNHPDHAAIEHCEVCGDPLCDLCLWYADDGRRLCEKHAREHEAGGGSVQPPEQYAVGIRVREVEEAAAGGAAPFRGNDTDVLAAVSAVVGGAALLSMCGFSYCLPILAGILGLVVVMDRRKSLNPDRTRTLGVLGIVLSAAGLLPILFFFAFFFCTITTTLIASSGSGP